MWRNNIFRVALAIVLSVGGLGASSAMAGGHRCDVCGAPCVSYEVVEKTVMVPVMTTEQRTVRCVVARPEIREKTVTVMKQVPVTQQVTRDCTVLVPEPRVCTEQYTVCKPIWETATRQYTDYVSRAVVMQGVHTVCKPVEVTETRVVCEDQGHFEPAGGGCGVPSCRKCCSSSCSVWVPNIVKKEVPVTVCKIQTVDEPYQYTDYVCEPVTRTCNVKVCRYEYEQKTREVTYTECVPKTVQKTFDVVSFKCVPEERVCRFTVMVPQEVERVVCVPVCKMVPKTVTCRVPVAYGCATCCP